MSSVIGNAGSKRRQRTFIGVLALAFIATMLVVPGAFSASTSPSVVDYVQCANGKPGTPDPDTCNKGWIGGILNANNSQYHENEVTAQRLIVDFPAGSGSNGAHSLDIKYLIQKAEAHAYDSLATWDTTISDAGRCDGLTGPTKTACDGATGGAPDTLAIDDDSHEVDTACTTESAVTSDHQLPGQEFQAFGPGVNLTNMEYGVTSTDSEGTYQSIHIDFTLDNAGRFYLYFGGHLAAGGTPATGSANGWGEDCGAGSISGGPYHIKLVNIDGASAGNRDNQIMSGAVLPLFPPTITTQPSAVQTVTLGDSLNLGNAAAGGTASFYLYDSDTACQADTAHDGTGSIFSSADQVVTAGEATSATHDVSPTATTTYYWTVVYSGDAGASLAPGFNACAETTLVTIPVNTP
jgi:hypothetical protein